MTQPVMRRVKGDGVEIELALWEGKRDPVFCIHALTANCRSWDTFAGLLTPRHTVMALDLRGRGRSEKPSSGYDIDHHCRDIESVLSTLQVQSYALMGHSLGAVIALAYAAKHPEQVKRIVLIDGAGRLSEDQKKKVISAIQPSLERLGRIFPSFEAYRESLQESPNMQPWSDAMDTYFRYDLEEVEGGVRSRIQLSAIEEELRNLQDFDLEGLYPLVRCPVLILRAKRGMLQPDNILLPEDVLEKMLRELPHANCVDVEDANHYTIMFQNSEIPVNAIRTFLAGKVS